MEASLPSLITKAAPPDAKGTAMGLYSSAQFLGIFAGGVAGGWAHQTGGGAGVFALTPALALLWLIAAATMAQPSYLTTRLLPIGDGQAADAESLAARLRQVPGVAEAVVIAEEKLAYLKVDFKTLRRGHGAGGGRRILTALQVFHDRARIRSRHIPAAATTRWNHGTVTFTIPRRGPCGLLRLLRLRLRLF